MSAQLHSSSLAEWLLWHHPRFRRGRYADRKGTGRLSAAEVRAVGRRFAVLEPESMSHDSPQQGNAGNVEIPSSH